MRNITFLTLLLLQTAAASAALDIPAIEQAAGVKGKWFEDEKVYKLSFPRDDVKVAVSGTQLPPFMGLTSWASFMSGREKAVMVMGDLVLLEDEVSAAMSAALIELLAGSLAFANPLAGVADAWRTSFTTSSTFRIPPASSPAVPSPATCMK